MCSDKQVVLKHLGYEWWMFRCMKELLPYVSPSDDPIRNAMAESLGIHGRDLIDFFYRPPTKPDDWTVRDVAPEMVSTVPTPQHLTDWCVTVNKCVAHITNVRAEQLQLQDAQGVYDAIEAKISALKGVLGAEFPADWSGDEDTRSSLVSRFMLDGAFLTITGNITTGSPANLEQ